jgi:glycosyltransferase involved in cell wall biosynthesis
MQVGMAGPERRFRLLTIGHSYVVAGNRRLAHEMAVQGRERWDVTAVAPERFRGDMRRIAVEPIDGEASTLRTASIRFDRSPHLMWYAKHRQILREAWDVVHCWEEPFVLSAAQIAKAAPAESAFVVSSFQNIDKHYPWPLGAFERSVVRRANGWIAFGETVHQTLMGRPCGYRDKASRVIPPGVDTVEFAPDPNAGREVRRQLQWSDDVPVVGFTGRFVAEKGVLMLADALKAIKAPWRALFVGAGPLEADLRSFAAAHPDRVRVVTGVPHGEMPRWLNAMSMLCAPSQTRARWREQFGRMSIEAMACGVPVIASDSGEIPHVVGDAGLLVGESDRATWRETIERVLHDPAVRCDLARRGRARVEQRFAWPVVARQHLEFFESLVLGPPKA